MKVGFLGAGRVATRIAEAVERDGHEVAFKVRRNASAENGAAAGRVVGSLDRELLAGVDLVIEAAAPGAVRQFGAAVLDCCDLAILSATVLADPAAEATLRDAARRGGTRFTVLPGGIVGLDGLSLVGNALWSVEIATSPTQGMSSRNAKLV